MLGYQGHLQGAGRYNTGHTENLGTWFSSSRADGLSISNGLDVCVRQLKQTSNWKTFIRHVHLSGCLYNQYNEILIFSKMNSSLEVPLFFHCLWRDPWLTVLLKKIQNLGSDFFTYDFLYFSERVSWLALGKKSSGFYCFVLFCFIQ